MQSNNELILFFFTNIILILKKIPIFSIFSKDIYNLIDNKIKKDSDKRGFSYKGFWDISKYILENLSEKTRPFKIQVNNEVINHLLTAPILQEDGNFTFIDLKLKN